MALFTEPDILSEDIAEKVHNFDTDSFAWLLTPTAPTLSTTFTAATTTGEIATGGGYTKFAAGAGGLAANLSTSRTGQTTTINQAVVTLTASGAVATFRYLVLVNATQTSPAYPVVGWLDHGSTVTMAATDTYTIPAGALFTINA